MTREWAEKHFAMLADEKYASNTLTTIKNTKEISVSDLNKELAKRGYMISNGYGKLKDVTFRIAHMADTQMDDLKQLLKTIEEILGL